MLPPPQMNNVNLVTVVGGLLLSFDTDAPLQVTPPYVLSVTAAQPRFGLPLGPRARPRRISVSAALNAIPVVNAIPNGPDPLQLIRSRGSADATTHQFAVVTRVPVSQFVVTLTSPDGRTATFTQEV
jgi:hypothetical protein